MHFDWEFTVSWKKLKYTHALRIIIVFLFVKTEKFSSKWKSSTASQVFTDLLSNSPKRSPRFLPGYKGTENMFYFLTNFYFILQIKGSEINVRAVVRDDYYFSLTTRSSKMVVALMTWFFLKYIFSLGDGFHDTYIFSRQKAFPF